MFLGPVDFQYLLFASNLALILGLWLISFIESDRLKLFISAILLVLMSGMIGSRAIDVGVDSEQYADLFVLGYSERTDIEPVFLVLAKLLGMISKSPEMFFVTLSIGMNLAVLLGFRRIDRHEYPILFAMFATSFLFVNMNINIIRQGLAMALSFYGVTRLAIDKDKRSFLLWGTLAVFTHLTAIVFLGAAILAKVRAGKVTIILYLVVFLVLAKMDLLNIVEPIKDGHWILGKLYWYLTWPYLNPWGVKHYYYFVFLVLGTVLLRNATAKDPDEKQAYVAKLMMIGILALALLKNDEMLADRTFYYFLLPFTYLVYGIYRLVAQSVLRNPAGATSIAMVFAFAWMVKSLYQYGNWFVAMKS